MQRRAAEPALAKPSDPLRGLCADLGPGRHADLPLGRSALPPQAVLGFSDVEVHGNALPRLHPADAGADRADRAGPGCAQARARALALRAVLPVLLLTPLLMLAVWWVISRSLAPMERMRRQVAGRRADDLSPLPSEGLPRRGAPLVDELNLLFGRVRGAFEAQQHFVADAAHELRSPLTALKLQAQALRRAATTAERDAAASPAQPGHRPRDPPGRAAAGAGPRGRRRRPAKRPSGGPAGAGALAVSDVLPQAQAQTDRPGPGRAKRRSAAVRCAASRRAAHAAAQPAGQRRQVHAGRRPRRHRWPWTMDSPCWRGRQRPRHPRGGRPRARVRPLLPRARRLRDEAPGSGLGLAIVKAIADRGAAPRCGWAARSAWAGCGSSALSGGALRKRPLSCA
jgi:hypothetical protein